MNNRHGKNDDAAQPPFNGRWRITSMTAWDQHFVNEEVEGYFQFNEKGQGEFHFGFVHGYMDCAKATKDGQPAIEWTWDGNNEMEAAHGRGWAVLKGVEIHGMIFFHGGDESGFVARKKVGKKGK